MGHYVAAWPQLHLDASWRRLVGARLRGRKAGVDATHPSAVPTGGLPPANSNGASDRVRAGRLSATCRCSRPSTTCRAAATHPSTTCRAAATAGPCCSAAGGAQGVEDGIAHRPLHFDLPVRRRALASSGGLNSGTLGGLTPAATGCLYVRTYVRMG